MTPRLRNDLQASPVEEAGLRFVDVSDPRAGTAMRLYEHEWLLASRMDGTASLDEVSRWAGEHVGFRPTVSDLVIYARRLGELGFFDEPVEIEVGAASAVPASHPGEAQPAGASADETSFADVADAPVPPAHAVPVSDLAPPVAGDAVPLFRPDMETPTAVEPVPPARPAQQRQPAVAPSASPVVDSPSAASTWPVEPGASSAAERAGRRSRAAVFAAVTLGGVIVAGAVAYLTVIAPALAPVHVRVEAVSPPRDVFHYFDARATVTGTPPMVLSFLEAGRVNDVATAGTETRPGMTLASLDGYALMEKELADVRDRETFYENALKAALSRHNDEEATRAGDKVQEKRRIRAALEDKVARARIVAPGVATVAEVLVSAGSTVAAGAPVIKLTDKQTFVEANVGASDAQQLKVGQVVPLATTSGAIGAGRVAALDAGRAKLDVTDDANGAIKSGQQVMLVRSKLAKVIRIPASALWKSQGGADLVFVLAGEVVQGRRITIAERTATDVYVSAGLEGGERVVVGAAKDLAEGAKAIVD